jgi:hypothetical protein
MKTATNLDQKREIFGVRRLDGALIFDMSGPV